MSNKNKHKKHHNKKHDIKDSKTKVTVEDFEHISIFNSPILSLRVLLSSAWQLVKDILSWCLSHILIIILVIAILAAFLNLPGPHEPYRAEIIDFTTFAAYWIGLGVASSIGLGTGLHTFILYLGPHIA